jgi:Ca2+-binding EF-hand superfamily protein
MLQKGLHQIGIELNDSNAEKVFKFIDNNNDGYIDLQEWMKVIPERIVGGAMDKIK